LIGVERFLADTLAGITREHDRRLVHAYATWRVLRRATGWSKRGHE
jgi:hypothetical protein